MPLMRWRVVCTFGDTIASFSPMRALSRVLFPALGLPNMETNPDFMVYMPKTARHWRAGPQSYKKRTSLRSWLWLRRVGSNHRPSGYEPDELPLLYFAMWRAKVRGFRFIAK